VFAAQSKEIAEGMYPQIAQMTQFRNKPMVGKPAMPIDVDLIYGIGV
jgi:hypothetical protein